MIMVYCIHIPDLTLDSHYYLLSRIPHTIHSDVLSKVAKTKTIHSILLIMRTANTCPLCTFIPYTHGYRDVVLYRLVTIATAFVITININILKITQINSNDNNICYYCHWIIFDNDWANLNFDLHELQLKLGYN